MIKILALSGSLRKASSNTTILRAAASLAPSNIKIEIFNEIGNLPLFNPDLEGNEPLAVLDFRSQINFANGILIASPEYAHGVTGTIKNALDWTVGSGEFTQKPVALLNASPRARHAHESLQEILTTMMAHIITEASLTIPVPHNRVKETDILSDKMLSGVLLSAIISLASAVKSS